MMKVLIRILGMLDTIRISTLEENRVIGHDQVEDTIRAFC